MLQPPTLRTNVASLMNSNQNNNMLTSVSSSVVGSIPTMKESDDRITSPHDLEDIMSNSPSSSLPQQGLSVGASEDAVSIVINSQETTITSPSDISALVDSFFYNNGPTRMTEARKVFLFQVSTIIGTFVFFIFYQFLYQFITAEDESTKSSLCWLLSYSLSIWCQYELHCRIVFGKRSNSEYWRSLIRTYFVYGISMVFSTILNYLLVGYFQVGHTYAWILSLILVGILNYFTVSRFAFADDSEESV